MIAQDQATSKVWGLYAAAIATDGVNWVLPLDKSGQVMAQLVVYG